MNNNITVILTGLPRSGKKIVTILQLIKETGMRIGEAPSLEWTGLDLESNTIKVNSSEKESNSRIFKASAKLIAMLNALPRTRRRSCRHLKARYV